VKRLSSPETVQDPHSFFVRLSAELGIPATVLIAILILWCVLSATRTPAMADVAASRDEPLRLQIVGVTFCACWWGLHQLMAETSIAYSVILSFFAALLAIGGWLIGAGLLVRLNSRGLRIASLALLVGAVGMLAYDQINMALVTGPVATLFWVMLLGADSYGPASRGTGIERTAGSMAGVAIAATGIVIAVLAWYPTLTETMPWDDRPHIDQYLQNSALTPQNLPAAKEAILKAIALDPRSVALRRQLMLLKEQLHEPVEEDERQILALDRTDMRLRISMATEPKSLPLKERLQLLPAAERVRLLKEALYLNDQLPQDELMRLTDDEKKTIADALSQLAAATAPGTAPAAR
jgi:hypothetical protein